MTPEQLEEIRQRNTKRLNTGAPHPEPDWKTLGDVAALLEENARLRAALLPFAEYAEANDGCATCCAVADHEPISGLHACPPRLGDCRAAREALK